MWRNVSHSGYPRAENDEWTQLGSDEWRAEWKYHCYKSIHCYQNQILNRNGSGNVSKEMNKLTQGWAKLTTDEPQVVLCINDRRVGGQNIEYSRSDMAIFAMK